MRELAELLQQAAERLAAGGAVRTEARGARASSRAFNSRAHPRRWRLGLATAAVGLALALWAGWSVARRPVERASVARAAVSEAERPDAGTAGLGEAASIAPEGQVPGSSGPQALTQDTLPQPVPGQARPDAKGRCPYKKLVALNGACWLKAGWDHEECELARGQMFKGECYVPFIPPGRQPTSDPP